MRQRIRRAPSPGRRKSHPAQVAIFSIIVSFTSTMSNTSQSGGGAAAGRARSPEPDISQLSFASARAAYQPGPDDKAIIQVHKNRVVTDLPHGFVGNDPVIFSGYPPNGINPGTIYFVFSGNVEDKSFQITSVAGGSTTININDSNAVFYCAPKKTVVHANVDIEILSDFGELDQFVIDGDGLVAHILADPTLDWNMGGQFLHAVYLAEVLVGKLLERNAVFTVVFFTESRHVWSHPSHRLLRELLRTILKKNSSDRAGMMLDYRSNLALVDQYRTSCKNFLDRCGKYQKLLSSVEKTLKEIKARSEKDKESAANVITLQQESLSAARALGFEFADSIASSESTCVLHLASVQLCNQKCVDDHQRAEHAVKELNQCISAASSLNEAANDLESTRMPGLHFVVRDDIPSCNSAQWANLLESARPRFVLSTDGRTRGAFTFGSGGVDQVGSFEHWATSHFLRQQAHILASGVSFVFFDGFKISERSVVGTIIQSLGRVSRSLEIATASYVTGAEDLRQHHSSCILEDQEINEQLSAVMNDASLAHLQQCQEASSRFTRDLLRQISDGSVQLNGLVSRVKDLIKDNRTSYMGCFRVLSELAGKYAQPYPAGSADDDDKRVGSMAECLDPDFEEEEDDDDDDDEESGSNDGSEGDEPKAKVAKTPQIFKIFQQALLDLARHQLEDIAAKKHEASCKGAKDSQESAIKDLEQSIATRARASHAAPAAAVTPAAASATTPKVDPRDPRSVAAAALARNTAPQAVQLSPQEKVEKCAKQVQIKETSLARAKEEGKDVAKAQKNLDDATADLLKAQANLAKHLEQTQTQLTAKDEQLERDKERLKELEGKLPSIISQYESARSALASKHENCKQAEAVVKFVSFWASCFSFSPSEYVVEVEKDGKTIVSPDMAYKQFGAIRKQIQQDSTKSVLVQTGLRKALQSIPSEVDRLTEEMSKLNTQLSLSESAKSSGDAEKDQKVVEKTKKKIAKCSKELENLQRQSIWSQWVFDYYALQKKAKQESEGTRSMQESTPLSDSQRLSASCVNNFTEHWATWLSISSQLLAGFEEFKACFSSVSSDLVSNENLCGAMLTDLVCFEVNSSLLSLSRQQLGSIMGNFPACASTVAVCQSFKSDISVFIRSKPAVWQDIIAAQPNHLQRVFCSPSQDPWQRALEGLLVQPDGVVGAGFRTLSSSFTWQAMFAAAVGRAAKALCSTFPSFARFSFNKMFSTVEPSAKAAILAVCVGNSLPLALRSINFSAVTEVSADVEKHLAFLNMVFAELVKGFPDRPGSSWSLATEPLVDAFDGRLCALFMGIGAASSDFLADLPRGVVDNVAAAWKIACAESHFEWPSTNTGRALQPWETATVDSFSLGGDIFPIQPVKAFTDILAPRRRPEDSELSVFSTRIPVLKRASRNYFFEKGQAILQAMGLDQDEFKRLNYSDAILELAQNSDAALEYIAGVFEFDSDEQGQRDKEKLKDLIRNPPKTDEEHPEERFYVPEVRPLKIDGTLNPASFPLGVLPEMYLNVNSSYYGVSSKVKVRKRCKCSAPFNKNGDGKSDKNEVVENCPFKTYHNCRCVANYSGKIQWNRNCPGYAFHPVSKEQIEKKALKLKQQKAAQERVSWLGNESSGITTVVNTRVLYHSFRLSLAYDHVKEYKDWKLLRKRFEDKEIPASEFNSQCEARMQPVKAGEGQVRDMCKQFPQLAIEMMLYRARKIGESAVAMAQNPNEKNFNPASSVYSLICSVISMFGPQNLSEWEEVSGVFLYYPEIPRDSPPGTRSTSALLETLFKYGERRGLDVQSIEKYRTTMLERLFKWRSVFETKEMLAEVGDTGVNHFDKVMREFRLFVGKTFFTYGFKSDLSKHLNEKPGDLLYDPLIDWRMQQDNWDARGLDRKVTSAVVFQLRHMGHMLTRSDGESPDSRITGWIPDRWQSELLDIVEGSLDGKVRKDGSVLVCAPTSAGKTFIALHVMRKVVQNENQRVIYVAPTKALCNEVQTRLEADFPNEIGSFNSTLIKLFQGRWEPRITEDSLKFRVDIMGGPGTNGKSTKILVLEPSSLEELLLSSDPDVLAWREQLVYVIFDEVHCLSTNPVWERLLAMVSCPFIALSATIGNPQHFLSWLQAVQNEAETGRQVRLVEHKTRYVDLRRHLYLPPALLPEKHEIVNQAKLSVKINCDHTSDLSGNLLKHLHPLCHLTQASFNAGQISTSLRQEPRDCMQLFDTMSEEIDAALKHALGHNNVGDIPVLELAKGAMKDLHPDQFFGFVLSINRWSVVSYEHALNSVLISWSQNPVLQPVAAKALISIGNMWLRPPAQAAALPEVTCQNNISGDLESISKNVLNLLCSLHQQDRLPALVFNFDTSMVEALAISTAQALEEAENKYVAANATTLHKTAQEAEKRLAKMAKDREKREKVTTEASDGTSRKDAKNLKIDAAEFGEEIDLEGHQDNFTFMRVGGRNDDEVTGAVEKIKKIPGQTKDMLLRCLLRGVGIHHAGLPTKYLHICEKLFRMGFLRVVFSTDTLAYGINMPCRTVIFAGDSVFLNSVQFQQMAGRAGRRGLDVLGHVVFCALPLHRLHRLVISGVPQMNGKHPELPVLVPKVLKYCQGLRYSRKSTQLCQRLVFDPLVHYNSDKSTFLWHIMACGHYMYHAGHVEHLPEGDRLTASGQVLAFAHTMAPAHFAFCHLYESGLLHEMCSDPALNLGQRCRALLTVMVALFKPLPLNPTYLKSRSTSRGQIVLTNLDEPRTDGFLLNIYPYLQRVNDQLQEFEQTSLNVLLSHASAAADRETNRLKFAGEALASDKDYVSPLTQTAYKRGKRLTGKPVKDGLVEKLGAQQAAFKCSSPFVATSGCGDNFSTATECVASLSDVAFVSHPNLLEQVQRERGTQSWSGQRRHSAVASRPRPVPHHSQRSHCRLLHARRR